MKRTKRVIILAMSMLTILLITACGGKTQKAVYILDSNGAKITTTLEYDKKDIVKVSSTEAKVNFEESGQGKEFWKAQEAMQREAYESMKGVEYKGEITDTELTYSTVINLKKLDKEKKDTIFGSVMDKDGNVELEKMGAELEAAGLKKK